MGECYLVLLRSCQRGMQAGVGADVSEQRHSGLRPSRSTTQMVLRDSRHQGTQDTDTPDALPACTVYTQHLASTVYTQHLGDWLLIVHRFSLPFYYYYYDDDDD